MAIEKRASKRSSSGYTYRVRYPDASRPGHWLSQTFDDYISEERPLRAQTTDCKGD